MPQMKCSCGGSIEVPPARLELVNTLTISGIVWAHNPITCQDCGAVVTGVIPEFDPAAIKLTYTPIPTDGVIKREPPSRIINPFA